MTLYLSFVFYQIQDDEMDKGKTKYTNMKEAIYHAAVRKILEKFIAASHTGVTWLCGDEVIRWIIPILLLLAADFKEQCVILVLHFQR